MHSLPMGHLCCLSSRSKPSSSSSSSKGLRLRAQHRTWPRSRSSKQAPGLGPALTLILVWVATPTRPLLYLGRALEAQKGLSRPATLSCC